MLDACGLHKDLIDMYNHGNTDVDIYNGTNEWLKYVTSIIEEKFKRTSKFKTTEWIGLGKDYSEMNSSVIRIIGIKLTR